MSYHFFVRDGEGRPVYGFGERPTLTSESGIPAGTPFFDRSTGTLYYWDGSSWNTVTSGEAYIVEVEFLHAAGSQNWPLAGAAIQSGTVSMPAAILGHPGISTLASHNSNTDSGYAWITGVTAFLLSGGETIDCVFRIDTLANLTAYIGFIDTITVTAPADGVYFQISGGVLNGRASAGSVATATSTSFTPSAGVWYRGRIVVSADRSQVAFYLYDYDSGSLLWSSVVVSGLPGASGTDTGVGLNATKSTAGTVNLLSVDYFKATYPRPANRR